MRSLLQIAILLWTLSSFAQGPYSPAANQLGTTAIHKDSSLFVGWVATAKIQRGKQNIEKTNSDTTSVGSKSSANGIADGNVISLGDGGIATLQFTGTIFNGLGPDFAVFENAFNSTFLELAFVEVSSNGVDFFRFASQSLTDTNSSVGSFGSVEPTNVHNLAGKYQANFGTPFDLEELKNKVGLDVNNIHWVRIVDVVGTLNDSLAKRDSQGRKINDQFPTEFPSGGFDLDAIGAIHLKPVGLNKLKKRESISVYPIPADNELTVKSSEWRNANYQIFSLDGKLLETGILNKNKIDFKKNYSGFNILKLDKNNATITSKIIFR